MVGDVLQRSFQVDRVVRISEWDCWGEAAYQGLQQRVGIGALKDHSAAAASASVLVREPCLASAGAVPKRHGVVRAALERSRYSRGTRNRVPKSKCTPGAITHHASLNSICTSHPHPQQLPLYHIARRLMSDPADSSRPSAAVYIFDTHTHGRSLAASCKPRTQCHSALSSPSGSGPSVRTESLAASPVLYQSAPPPKIQQCLLTYVRNLSERPTVLPKLPTSNLRPSDSRQRRSLRDICESAISSESLYHEKQNGVIYTDANYKVGRYIFTSPSVPSATHPPSLHVREADRPTPEIWSVGVPWPV